jgi:hypothetical protein
VRKKRPDIWAIYTATKIITLDSGQCFYETPKAYEIWQQCFYETSKVDEILQDNHLRRVLRIPKKRVLWVIERYARVYLKELEED